MSKSTEQIILDNVRSISQSATYKAWILEQKSLAEDDIVLLNNSFIYRDVSTIKNEKYLGFSVMANGKVKELFVVQGIKFNTEFRLARQKQTDYTKIKLADAIKLEKKTLGKLVFILIGVMDDDVPIEAEINSSILKKIILNPSSNEIKIDGTTIYINDASDEEIIWDLIYGHFKESQDFLSKQEHIKSQIGHLIDELQGTSYSVLKIPEKLKRTDKTVTEALVEMLDNQITAYKTALAKCGGDPTQDKSAYNEVLRIAYNFASDALTFVRLVVSICDLKPLILWGTVNQHYRLVEKFNDLPWIRSNRKASLSGYKGIIGGARNSSFHNLFPFKRSVEISIPDKSLTGVKLRTFSEYSRRGGNSLRFQDKELVDVLMEFTRSSEYKVPPSFWLKNIEVLIATRNLFETTSAFLKQLLRESSK